jgi:2-polyprenyl-3-methyl-5-hydroxy-6-metoxy-1,4-benzoquinol methylase
MLARAGARSVHGMDLSPEAVEYCKSHDNVPNLLFSTADAQNFSGIPDASFDLVVSFETIEHLPSVEVHLGEIWRVLRSR